jgi:CheY-like chemotaxis protein
MARILIIEDAWLTRRAICKALQAQGHETLEATNGREGLELINTQETIDCMLLDLLMPEVDGWGVLEALKQQNSKLPVIVLTADIQESTRHKCLELGALALLNKPPKSDELRQMIQLALGLQESIQ